MTRARQILDVLLGIAGIYIFLFGLLGFLAQMFFGTFSFSETAVSVSGFLAVLFAAACRGAPRCRAVAAAVTFVALCCVGFDALQYYRLYDSPGNDYAWGARVPFILCLVLVGLAGSFASSESQA
jgi:uncharacterized membrane protein